MDPTRLANYVAETAGNSIYHGLTVAMEKRFSRNYQLIASYTYSKTITDAADFNFVPQDSTNTRADRSLSPFDVRHRLTIAGVFDSPFRGGSGSPWYQRTLAGFYLAPILTARSGFPFDIRTGIDVNMDNNFNDRPFAVGRNTGLGPGFFALDLRLGRRIRFGADESRSLEILLDAFNIFNRVNFKEVNSITGGVLFLDQLGITDVRLRGSADKPASSFSGFTSAYDPRIIQLGLKFNF